MPKGSLNLDDVFFDPVAFEDLITQHGVVFKHFKAITCPLGLVDPNDVIASHSNHVGCSNGFIYTYAGDVTVFISNNSAITNLTEMGLLDGSVISVTFPKNYNNNDGEVYVQLYDRFFVKDLAALTPNTQLIEANPVGYDKANYEIIKVEQIVDSNGKFYTPDSYQVQNGQIHWVGNNRPGFDPQVGKGIVYSVRYLYVPYFFCGRLMHEVRLINKRDYVTNAPTVVRAPYQALLNREYYQYKQQNTNAVLGSTHTKGEMLGARDSIFPPR
jgi:hypothetical protein